MPNIYDNKIIKHNSLVSPVQRLGEMNILSDLLNRNKRPLQ